MGDDHVFTMDDGRALDPAYVTRLFQKLRKQGEPLPELTFHGLRHCYGSYLLATGTDIAIVSKLMGHSSIWCDRRHLRAPHRHSRIRCREPSANLTAR
jgi:integrase